MPTISVIACTMLSLAAVADEGGATAPTAGDTMTNSTPSRGPAIVPSSALHAWLDDHNGTMIRLPVVVEAEVLGLGASWIGTSTADPTADAIRLFLDDSAMGIGVSDHLRTLCGQPPVRCVVWLDGFWGATIPLPNPMLSLGDVEGAPSSPFSVRNVAGVVGADDEPIVWVVH